MTVVDVNTGKFVGSGGNLEETVTKNNLEAAEEIVRQLRLRDIGGIIVIDFIDMVLESNRDLVVRRLLECLGRDRTKHQVAEVTSLGLVQMTRKRVGSGPDRGLLRAVRALRWARHRRAHRGHRPQRRQQRWRRQQRRRECPLRARPPGHGHRHRPGRQRLGWLQRCPGRRRDASRPARPPPRSPRPPTPRPCAAPRPASTTTTSRMPGCRSRSSRRSPRPPSTPRSTPRSPSRSRAPSDAGGRSGRRVTPECRRRGRRGRRCRAGAARAEPEPEPAAPRGRRRRGRVVAPAGPPRATASDDGGSEAATEPPRCPPTDLEADRAAPVVWTVGAPTEPMSRVVSGSHISRFPESAPVAKVSTKRVRDCARRWSPGEGLRRRRPAHRQDRPGRRHRAAVSRCSSSTVAP